MSDPAHPTADSSATYPSPRIPAPTLAARLSALCAEVRARLTRTALSLELAEAEDHACVFHDRKGRALAESTSSPLHGGLLGAQVAALLDSGRGPAAGEIYGFDDPGLGATSNSDERTGSEPGLGYLMLLVPIAAAGGAVLGYLSLAARALATGHGPAPELDEVAQPATDELEKLPPAVGPRYRSYVAPATPTGPLSPPQALLGAGCRLRPTKWADGLERELSRRAADPSERLGDLRALRGAMRYGERRFGSFLSTLPEGAWEPAAESLYRQAAVDAAAALERLGSGLYAFADSLELFGSQDLGLRATLRCDGKRLLVDLRDSDDATPLPGAVAGLGMTRAITVATVRAAVAGLVRCGGSLLPGDGLLESIEIHSRPGSLCDAPPGAVGGLLAFETAARLYDVLLGALAQGTPASIPAASGGAAGALFLSGRRFAYVESLPEGEGGSPQAVGRTAQAPRIAAGSPSAIESLEDRFPVRVMQQARASATGGSGVHSGGAGLRRELKLLDEATVELSGDRRRRPPYGLAGGGPGPVGRDSVLREGAEPLLPARVRVGLHTSDVLVTETPGGGGHGDAQRALFFASLLDPELATRE